MEGNIETNQKQGIEKRNKNFESGYIHSFLIQFM